MPRMEGSKLPPLRHPLQADPDLFRLPLQAHHVGVPSCECPRQEALPHLLQAALQDAPVPHLLLVTHLPLCPEHDLCTKVHPRGRVRLATEQESQSPGFQQPSALAGGEAFPPPMSAGRRVQGSLLRGESDPAVEKVPPRVSDPESEGLKVGLPEVPDHVHPPEEARAQGIPVHERHSPSQHVLLLLLPHPEIPASCVHLPVRHRDLEVLQLVPPFDSLAPKLRGALLPCPERGGQQPELLVGVHVDVEKGRVCQQTPIVIVGIVIRGLNGRHAAVVRRKQG